MNGHAPFRTPTRWGSRPARLQQVDEVLEGEAGVHDVLDDEEVATLEPLVEILDELHLAGGLRGLSV